MKRKMFGLIVAATAGIIFLTGITLIAYAHDPAPAAGNAPDKSHIHVKGRITTPDGRGVEGASLQSISVNAVMERILQGLPAGCLSDVGGVHRITDANGSYDVIFFINTDQPCRDAFDRVTVDKTRMIWIKDGYEIRPR